MTSQASLMVNRKAGARSPWVHSFWQAVRENAVVTIINLILFLAVISVSNLIFINMRNGLTEPTYLSLKYSFFHGPAVSWLFPAMALELALLQGVLLFRFLFSKKLANAWLGMGISRSSLFWSRFAAGAVGMLLPIVLSMAVSLVVNLATFSDVGLILSRFCFLLSGMCIQAFVLYCITVLVCSATATIVEALGYSLIMSLLPTAFVMSLNALMVKFLFGNGYGISDQMYYNFNPTLVKALSNWNPILFMSPYMDRFASESTYNPANASYFASLPPLSINEFVILGWAAASLVLIWLAHRVFKTRKVEKAGILGSGKVVAFASVLTVSFFAFCIVFMLPLDVTQNMSSIVMLSIAVASAIIAMAAMAIPLKLISRPIWKGMIPLVSGLVGMAAIIVVLGTGGLGFSNSVPSTNDIKSVAISYNGLGFYLSGGSGGYNSGLFGERIFDYTVTLTDKTDFPIITQIHQKLIKVGPLAISSREHSSTDKVYNILTKIDYTLNDGRIVSRAYRGITPELMISMINLDNTIGVKKAFADFITEKDTDGHSSDGVFVNGDVYICNKYYSQNTPVTLSEPQHAELLQCIINDLASQSAVDRYLPTEPELCIIAFVPPGSSLENVDMDMFDKAMVYVTPQFKQTIAFLQQYSLMVPTQLNKEIDYVGLLDYNKVNHMYDYNVSYSFPIFINGTGTQKEIEYYKQDYGLKLFITDSSQQQEILAHSHSMYLACDGGYIVFIKYKGNEKISSAFLPMKDAPEYVKQGAK